MALAEESAEAPKRERWSFQWKELHEEVITSGLCTGCAGCVISCPYDVIGYDHVHGGFKPFHIEEELGEAIRLGSEAQQEMPEGTPPLDIKQAILDYVRWQETVR